MLKLLIEKKSRAKILAILESITWAFKTFQEKVKEPKERCSLSKGKKKKGIYCQSNKNDSFFYWYIYLKLVFEFFYKYYTNTERYYKTLKEFQAKIVEWKKRYPKKGIIVV